MNIELLKLPCDLLKLVVPAIFYQIFSFSPNDSSFRSGDIQIFVIFSLPFHTFQI